MSGWEVRFSNSRQVPYFYNASTRESVWDPPAGLSPQQISSLPGADRYLQGSAPAPAAAGASKPGQVRASHILAKHTGSRRPSSWKQVRDDGSATFSHACFHLSQLALALPVSNAASLGDSGFSSLWTRTR